MTQYLSKYVLRIYLEDAAQTVLSGGTAVPIAPGLILTADHNFEDHRVPTDLTIVLQTADGVDECCLAFNAENVVYRGSPENDLALIKTNYFDKLGQPFTSSCSLAEAVREAEFYSWGFPAFTERQGNDTSFYFSGSLAEPKEQAIQQLTVTQNVSNCEDWQGASGSPIVSNNRIVGILSHNPTYTDNTLEYTSIGLVYQQDVSFRTFFNFQQSTQELDRKINTEATKQLKKVDDDFLTAVILKLGLEEGESKDRNISELLKFPDVSKLMLHLINQLKHRDYRSRKAKIARQLVAACRWLIINDLTEAQKSQLLVQTGLLDVSVFSFVGLDDYIEVPMAAQSFRWVEYDREGNALRVPTEIGASLNKFPAFDGSDEAPTEEQLLRFLYRWFVVKDRMKPCEGDKAPQDCLDEIKQELIAEYGDDADSVEAKLCTYFYVSEHLHKSWQTQRWFINIQVMLAPQARFFFLKKDNRPQHSQQDILLKRFRLLLELEEAV